MTDSKRAPIEDGLHRVRQSRAEEQARWQAFVRERALHDEVALLRGAREEGRGEGRKNAWGSWSGIGPCGSPYPPAVTTKSSDHVHLPESRSSPLSC